MNESLKKLLPILITVILTVALCILLFIIFKKNFCGNTKEIYTSPNNSGKIDLSNTPIQPSNAFKRGITLDRTTKNTDVNKTWPLINIWPLTDSSVSSVRTYSFNEWVKPLLSKDVKVFIGIDLKDSINVIFDQLNNFDSKSLSNIIGFSVANEPPHDTTNQDLINQTTSNISNRATTLRNYLNPLYTSKQLTTPPITVCFVTDTFNHYKSLFESKVLDPIFCSNIYGGLWDSGDKPSTTNELNKNLNWGSDDVITNQIKGIANTINGYKISGSRLWITEVGWPSTPMPKTLGFKNHSWTTVHTEQQLYTGFLTANKPSELLDYVFWFTIRDSNNESFGLFDKNFKSKFGDSPLPPPSGSSCDASGSISHGTIGNCTSTLADGATCSPTCDTGYTLSGNRTCNNGTLNNTANCNLITPGGGGYGLNEYPFKDGCRKGDHCNVGTLCFNKDVNNFSCQLNCSNPTKPDCVKYPPPKACQNFCQPPTPSGDGYKDGEDIFKQNCSKGKKCANPNSTICFNKKLQNFSCEPSCSNSITPDCVHNAPKNPTCKSVFC